MTSQLRALRNYLKHAHEDRTFRWVMVAALVMAVVLAGYIAHLAKTAEVVTVDGARCYARGTGWAMCPVPSPTADPRR